VRSNDDQLALSPCPANPLRDFRDSAPEEEGLHPHRAADSFEAFEERRLTRACPSGLRGDSVGSAKAST